MVFMYGNLGYSAAFNMKKFNHHTFFENMHSKFFLQKRPIGPHPVPAPAGAGSDARPTRGAL